MNWLICWCGWSKRSHRLRPFPLWETIGNEERFGLQQNRSVSNQLTLWHTEQVSTSFTGIFNTDTKILWNKALGDLSAQLPAVKTLTWAHLKMSWNDDGSADIQWNGGSDVYAFWYLKIRCNNSSVKKHPWTDKTKESVRGHHCCRISRSTSVTFSEWHQMV